MYYSAITRINPGRHCIGAAVASDIVGPVSLAYLALAPGPFLVISHEKLVADISVL